MLEFRHRRPRTDGRMAKDRKTDLPAGIRDALSATRDVASVIGSGSYSYVDDRSPVSGSNVVQIRNGTAVLYTE